jgi:hypothetical protein
MSWLVIAIFSIYMMFSVSEWVWRAMPFVQSLQFPWRYMTNLTLVASVVAAYSAFAIKKKPKIVSIILLSGSLCIIIYWSLYAAKNQYWNMYNNAKINSVMLETNIRMSFDLDHFRPKWVGENIWPRYSDSEERLEALQASHVFNEAIKTDRKQPEKLVANVSNKIDAWLIFDQFYYPGWTVKTSQGEDLIIKPAEHEGLITAWVPAGNHTLIFKLTHSTLEIIGMVTTCIALIMMIIMDMLLSRKHITRLDNNLFKKYRVRI